MANDDRLQFPELTVLLINTTLTRSPEVKASGNALVHESASIMAKQGVRVDQFRSVDHAIATGVYPDMRGYGPAEDAWPELFGLVGPWTSW